MIEKLYRALRIAECGMTTRTSSGTLSIINEALKEGKLYIEETRYNTPSDTGTASTADLFKELGSSEILAATQARGLDAVMIREEIRENNV